jgi:tetratricopeptide (TPR) repeat protein
MNQLRRRVQALIKTGAFIQAVTAAAEFTRRNPEMAESYGLLSHTEEVAGYTRAAIKTISHAIALAPHEPAYRFHRGRLHMKVNALTEARDDMAAVIEMEKDLAEPYYTEPAMACRDEALERMETLRAARPSGYPAARNHLR